MSSSYFFIYLLFQYLSKSFGVASGVPNISDENTVFLYGVKYFMMMFNNIPIHGCFPILFMNTSYGRKDEQIACFLPDFRNNPVGYGRIGLSQIKVINFFQALYC